MNPINQSTRGFNVIFIHSSLDDAGLSVAEFRVLAHLARRASSGAAWPSIDSISKKCRITKNTVRIALKALESHGVVKIEERPGATNVYHITSPEQWNFGLLDQSDPSQKKVGDPSQKEVGHPSQKKVGDPSQKEVGEGDPMKEIHEGEKGAGGAEQPAISIPETLNEPEFIDAWNSYVKHRKEGRKKLTPTAAAAALNKCARFGVARATIALWHSIENGWQGIFEPKSARVNSPRADLKPSEDGRF
jgi:predicted transcriptional regulator